MKLPLYISVPHAGTKVPPEIRDICALGEEDILADHDVGADVIYFPLQEYISGFHTTEIARSIVDLNRHPQEIGGNGVIKNHTCCDIPVYKIFPDEMLIRDLLASYYFPYHAKLTADSGDKTIRLGIDCHTMAVIGPPVSPDPGLARPLVCISNDNTTCPAGWIDILADCLASAFNNKVAINMPFRGGYISRLHAAEMPWVQIEISQTAAHSNQFKSHCILEGLQSFCHTVFGSA